MLMMTASNTGGNPSLSALSFRRAWSIVSKNAARSQRMAAAYPFSSTADSASIAWRYTAFTEPVPFADAR